MAVVLNEPALVVLLEAETGPVGLDLARRAERVTVQARRNAAVIISRFDVGTDIGFDITHDSLGLVARVGVVGEGRISRYLEAKAEREAGGGWLVPALSEAEA